VALQVRAAADRLEAHVPEPPPPVTHIPPPESLPPPGRGTRADAMATGMAFDVVIGAYSPLALPVEISFEPPGAVGRGRFTLPYEGPPGCVHGAVIAATFDIILTAANMAAGTAGPTVSLTTKYRRPTLLQEDARFEAWVERTEERRVFTAGRVVQRGAVTVEAEGVFALIDQSRTRALGATHRRSEPTER
jgi:acyl-coenzyme A thioesterase PaaI-like protein